MRFARHNMNFHTTFGSPDQSLDDYRILISFVLYEKGMFGTINKMGDPVAAIALAPDHVGFVSEVEIRTVPIRRRAGHHFIDLMRMVGCYCIITGFRKVFCSPVQ